MLILFFDSKSVIHHKYVPEGQTVNVTFYVLVLDRSVWGQKCGEIRSSFFSTMHICTLQQSSSSFWQKSSGAVESSFIFSRYKPRLFRFPRIKIAAERWPLGFD